MSTGRFASADNQSSAEHARHLPGVRLTGMRGPTTPQASERRLAEKRARRHREQAVAEWLRSLAR